MAAENSPYAHCPRFVHEGHKREIRRLFAALQYRVLRLVRVRVAEIQLYGILPGDYRVLEGSL